MTTLEILRAARKLIEQPEAWTQEMFALNADGIAENPGSNEACKWCSIGAVIAASGSTVHHDWETLPGMALLATKGMHVAKVGNIAKWNDTPGRRHSTVLRAFDRAIEFAEMEERT